MKSMKIVTKILLAVFGVLLAAAGIFCLANPLGAVSTAAWIVGVVLLVTGIGTAIYYFFFASFLVVAFPILLNAIADILFGVIFLQHPDGTSRVFTVLYGMLLILVGLTAMLVALIVRRFVERKGVLTGILVAGLALVVLGVVALSSDAMGALLIAIPVGIGLVLMGAAYIGIDVLLIRAEKAGKTSKYFKDVEDNVIDVDFEDVSDDE